jgi:hypothetical protein
MQMPHFPQALGLGLVFHTIQLGRIGFVLVCRGIEVGTTIDGLALSAVAVSQKCCATDCVVGSSSIGTGASSVKTVAREVVETLEVGSAA